MTGAYLVQFGRSGFVGRFQAACDFAQPLAHGDRVVVRGPRGVELGTVLCEPADAPTRPLDGELLRAAADADEAAAARLDEIGQALLAAAEITDLPISFIDSEVSLDGTAAVLHGLPWGECDASPLFTALSDRFGLAVRFLDLARLPAAKDDPVPAAGCGKPGCGTEKGGCSSCGTDKGGCSTGSCSKGKVKSADELTAYFQDLRRQMEAAGMARTPLV